jgi:hypothetical protein
MTSIPGVTDRPDRVVHTRFVQVGKQWPREEQDDVMQRQY